MEKKFECWNCGKTFLADDSQWVECPHCHSDNVEYATYHIPAWTKWIVPGVVVVGGLGYGISQIDWSRTKAPEIDMTDSTAVEAVKIDSTFVGETGLAIPATLTAGDLTFDEEGYSFEANVENASEPFHFVIKEAFGDKVVATSKDGKFSKVPFSKAEGGSYKICAISDVNDSIIASIDKSGFIKQAKVASKMSIADLQAKIDAKDPSLMGTGENDYLAPDYTLTIQGLPKDAVNVPKILAQVFEKLNMGTWSSAKVVKLDYDDLNRISGITLKVVEDDFDF